MNTLSTLAKGLIKNNATPSNLSYHWNYGSLLGLCLIIQIVSGIFLAMHYISSVELAFDSVESIMREVYLGWLIRYIRANGASMFFFFVYLRIGKAIYYSSYKQPRTNLWYIGVAIYFVMMATAFIGYVLPWSQISFWGGTVITNFISAIPFVGHDLTEFVWGGFSVGEATLNRFFSLRYLLPFVLSAIVIVRLLTLKESGSGNPLGLKASVDYVLFRPYYTYKDLVTVIIAFMLLIAFVGFNPTVLLDHDHFVEADPMVTPVKIVPEWYFLPFYAILRSIPDKLTGVIAIVSAIAILFFLPKLDFSIVKGLRFRPLTKLLFWFRLGNFLLLGWIGSQRPVYPWDIIGAYSTIFYFLFYVMFLPIVSFIENLMLLGPTIES